MIQWSLLHGSKTWHSMLKWWIHRIYAANEIVLEQTAMNCSHSLCGLEFYCLLSSVLSSSIHCPTEFTTVAWRTCNSHMPKNWSSEGWDSFLSVTHQHLFDRICGLYLMLLTMCNQNIWWMLQLFKKFILIKGTFLLILKIVPLNSNILWSFFLLSKAF